MMAHFWYDCQSHTDMGIMFINPKVRGQKVMRAKLASQEAQTAIQGEFDYGQEYIRIRLYGLVADVVMIGSCNSNNRPFR